MSDVGYLVSDQVATLTLDRPAKRNALTPPMVKSLRKFTAEAATDSQVRVLMLTGEGPSFCAGADLSAAGEQSAAELTSELAEFLNEWMGCPKPTVANVHGPAAGGGNGLVAACDVVVASTDAYFALREVRVGVCPAVIAVPLLNRLSASALGELALTGRRIGAGEARHLGLVDWVVRPELLDSKVGHVCGDLVRGGPAAQAATKSWLRSLAAPRQREALTAAAALSGDLFDSDEAREGMAAFREKRPPNW